MSHLECGEHVGRDANCLRRRKGAFADLVAQSAAGEALHHQVRQPSLDSGVVDRHQIGVGNPGSASRLLLETEAPFVVRGQLGAELLDRDGAPKDDVVPLEDSGRASPPEESAHPVPPREQLPFVLTPHPARCTPPRPGTFEIAGAHELRGRAVASADRAVSRDSSESVFGLPHRESAVNERSAGPTPSPSAPPPADQRPWRDGWARCPPSAASRPTSGAEGRSRK